jgi:ABC-type uncharacterized transport system permease subunit
MAETVRLKTPTHSRPSALLKLVSPLQFLLGVILALLAGALLLLIFREDPLQAYQALLQGSMGSKRTIAETILSATPLIFGGAGGGGRLSLWSVQHGR